VGVAYLLKRAVSEGGLDRSKPGHAAKPLRPSRACEFVEQRFRFSEVGRVEIKKVRATTTQFDNR
jgi:hypothetical protein